MRFLISLLLFSCGDGKMPPHKGSEFKYTATRVSEHENKYYVVYREGYLIHVAYECDAGVCEAPLKFFNTEEYKDGWLVLSSKKLYYVVYKKLSREGAKDEGMFFLFLICLILTSTSSGVYLKGESYKDTKTNELREEK